MKRPAMDPKILDDPFEALPKLVGSHSRNLLNQLDLPQEWVDEPPSLWTTLPSYQQATRKVTSLAVVNDMAEREVALVKDFNRKLTASEDQLQCLLQVVEDQVAAGNTFV